MPGGDQTGPNGGGQKTGRGLGSCADNDQPSYSPSQEGQWWGRGFGRGGRGCGRGNRFNDGFGPRRGRGVFTAIPVPNSAIVSLKSETQELRNSLQQILDRLDQLDK